MALAEPQNAGGPKIEYLRSKPNGEDIYAKLTHPDHIRLLTLNPGSSADVIECSMEVVRLGERSYEALSYAWGDLRVREPIRLNGKSFQVTKNLWLAMRHLRDQSKPIVMWIDAICINQRDNDEKSEQVAKMRSIYEGCHHCSIWLGESPGPAGESAAMASKLLDILGKDQHLWEMPCFKKGVKRPITTSEEYKEYFEAAKQVIDLAWWKRVWVVQELALPNEVEFICGTVKFSYEKARKGTEVLFKHCLECCRAEMLGLLGEVAFEVLVAAYERIGSMVTTREEVRKGKAINLTSLRRRFHMCQATNKRDLFYGLLGLVSNTNLQPDYASPWGDAIIGAAWMCVSGENGMEFLLGERTTYPSNRQENVSVPSWIPDTCFDDDLSIFQAGLEQCRLLIYPFFTASASHSQKGLAIVHRALKVQTCMVGTIDRVGELCQPLESILQAIKTFLQWMKMAKIGTQD
ncbi:heterokaryon incompatibility protein-domain-containing protein [Lasiosphaeria hispida]|uniref:Heterokaryon incompatibility protein-domain-containing protein n=1 Tax=Lasiosphaeria hispida TaxID=260671 RepID=A0AAJ0HAF5_9PEZI|nr:heterokaryon incompatibility protein-domain-containing protein [Lasiosphaeria hispida]